MRNIALILAPLALAACAAGSQTATNLPSGAAAYGLMATGQPASGTTLDYRIGTLDAAAPWARRIRGVRANASRKSHAELDASTTLDAGDPRELADQYRLLAQKMPWLNVFGGCCGTDLRHVTAIAQGVTALR